MDVRKIQKRELQAQKREMQAQKREMYINQVQIFPISLKVDTLPTFMHNQLKIQIYKRLLKDRQNGNSHQIDLLNIGMMTQTRYGYKMLYIFIHVATDWKERNQQRVPRRDFGKNRWKAALKYLQNIAQQIAVSLSTGLNQASCINCFSDLEQFLQSYTRKTYAISESIYSSALFIKGRDPSGHSMQLDTNADYFPQLALNFINIFSLGLFGKGPIFPSTKEKNSVEYFAQLAQKNRFSWQILDQNGAIRALREGKVITAQFFLKDVWHAFSIIGVDKQSKC